jgi:PEP-CTERM motif
LWTKIMHIKTRIRALIAVAALSAAAAGSARATEVLTNGSFEGPAIGSGAYTYPGSTLDSWTYGGSALVGATGSNAWYGSAPPAGQDGDQFAALQGTSTLSQTFTMVGTTLDISWLAGGRPFFGSYNGDQTYEVMLGSDVLGTFSTLSGEAFGAQSLVVHGLTAGQSYTLTFAGQVAADETSFIDKVSAQGAGAVPEPAAWGLMILGFGGVGAALRSKRRAFAAA